MSSRGQHLRDVLLPPNRGHNTPQSRSLTTVQLVGKPLPIIEGRRRCYVCGSIDYGRSSDHGDPYCL